MRASFPSRDQLSAMSLERLRLVDVYEKDEEELVQEIINSKVELMPLSGDVYRGDVPDIKTPEEEAEWQKKIDERAQAKRPTPVTLSLSDEETVEKDEEESTSTNLIEEPIVAGSKKTETRFCDFCDSKGVRHKKDCPTKKI